MTSTPPFSAETRGKGYFVSMRLRTAARMFLLASGPRLSSSLRRPAVALTAIGEHDRNFSGTLVTASSRSTSKLFAAPSTSVPYELRPEPPSFFSVILNKISSSSSGEEPQLLNL